MNLGKTLSQYKIYFATFLLISETSKRHTFATLYEACSETPAVKTNVYEPPGIKLFSLTARFCVGVPSIEVTNVVLVSATLERSLQKIYKESETHLRLHK